MKNLQTLPTRVRWKFVCYFFLLYALIVLLHQVIFYWLLSSTSKNLTNAFASVPYFPLIFYLFFPLFFSIILSLPLLFFLHSSRLRIHDFIDAVRSWSTGDLTSIIQDTKKDDVGQLAQELNEMASKLKQFIDTQKEQVAFNERNVLARELHDTVKQQIFALAFQVSVARKIHRSENDQLAMHLQEAKKILSDIQAELTNLITTMRKAEFEDQDLADALATFLSRWSLQYGIFIKFTTEIQGQEKNYFLSAQVKSSFFRVAQEALSNVGRHSKATSVHVTLTIGWLFVTLKIVDNGQGFTLTEVKNSSIGLSSMKERMKEINGDLSIVSQPHGGTQIIATYHPKETGPNVATITTFKNYRK